MIIGEAIIPEISGNGDSGAIIGSIIYRFAVFLALRLGFAPTDLKLVTAVLVIAALSSKSIKQRIDNSERRKAVRDVGTEVSL